MPAATAESSTAEPNADGPINVGARQVGAVYAKAFLATAEKAGQTDALVAELDALVELLRQMPKFQEVLFSRIVSSEDKERLLDQAIKGQASPTLLNFLKVVSRHGRLDCLRGIQAAAHEQNDAAQGRVPVGLATAGPIDDGLATKIAGTLRTMLGGEPIFTRSVRPELIGGVVLRVGDTVYDGSVATQLEQVREQMITRSVHEIQSRRDRFRDTSGS